MFGSMCWVMAIVAAFLSLRPYLTLFIITVIPSKATQFSFKG